MKHIIFALTLICLPGAALAESFVVMTGNLVVVSKSDADAIREDKDPKDGCGPVSQVASEDELIAIVMKQGCKSIPMDRLDAVLNDTSAENGCGRLSVAVVQGALPKWRPKQGCAAISKGLKKL